jgi:CRP-like cAMP-binding protein
MEQKIKKFQPGDVICKQGQRGGELFFIKTGKVELIVRHPETGVDTVVGTVGERSVIGTMSFLEGDERSATAKCLTEVECVVVDAQQREKLLDQIPAWFKVLIKDLTGNIRRFNADYTRLKSNYDILEKRFNILKKKEGGKDEAEKDDKADKTNKSA